MTKDEFTVARSEKQEKDHTKMVEAAKTLVSTKDALIAGGFTHEEAMQLVAQMFASATTKK